MVHHRDFERATAQGYRGPTSKHQCERASASDGHRCLKQIQVRENGGRSTTGEKGGDPVGTYESVGLGGLYGNILR